MIERELIAKVEVKNDEGSESNQFELEYYLTNTDSDSYGIEIKKKKANNTSEVKYLKDILTTKEQTINLLEQLVKSKVTPVTFEYIIEDFLGTY